MGAEDSIIWLPLPSGVYSTRSGYNSANALPLGENLQKRGLGSDFNCIRCQEKETKEHIFFKCQYAREVWKQIPLAKGPHILDDDSFEKAITKFRQAICLPPTGIRGSVLSWICWAIWNSRNTLVFEKKSYTSEETATKGVASAQEWNLAQQKIELHTSLLQKERETTSSNRRQQNGEAVICHTDASWEKERKRAGLAWMFSGSPPLSYWKKPV
ncbi:uncharacterized protein LOC103855383 [Brassica rapa]|uniref:uncharacterized protein LOC103855383 n=1 Tax=Brassica campestris TaxID=3711 RepID=UPI000871D69A|nr:uncharacterized protein LOC103855383 [Brassica rapa]